MSPRGKITITHSFAEGTLIEGMVRGDGSYEIVTAIRGWRWFRSLGVCGIAMSRDRMSKSWLIKAAVTALRDAEFEVDTQIDDDPRPVADREADRAARMEDRAERLTERAGRRAAESNAARDTADRLAEAMQGEPVKMDHHSAPRHLRDLSRVHDLTHKAIDLGKQAAYAAEGAQSAATHMLHRENPMLVVRRVERLESDRRDVQRKLEGHTRNFRDNRGEIYATDVTPPATGEWRERLLLAAIDLDAQIAHWTTFLEQARADGRYSPVDVAAIRPGDKIRVRHGWETVVKVNKTTITVQVDPGWDNKVKINEVIEHRAAVAAESEKS
jgi:hypothetical protein